ncbi:MAG: ammonia channel protein, partial [Vicinamibacterales bacterium]
MNTADIAWMLVSTALVLLMTPALAFFYGGLVRSKNALNTMMMSFVALGPVAVVWAPLGYSLAFAPGGPAIGSLAYAGLRGVG